MFGKMLKEAMQEKGMKAAKLAAITGIGKNSISQYLSGKNEPKAERKKVIAVGLGLPADYFEEAQEKIPYCDKFKNLPVEVAAKLMGKSKGFIYDSLKSGRVKWGYGVKREKKWSYYISPRRFFEENRISSTET